MAFKDALLQLSSYPEPTSAAAIEQAVVFAGALDARISALTFKIEIPTAGNVLANTLLDIPGMVAAERQKSAANAQALISTFKGMATKRGVPHEQIVESCTTSQLAAIVTEHARMHDITMIPIGEQATLQQYVAESVIFGSGRPTIILPEVPERSGSLSFDVVGVAWDFSRAAARAVADALPILERAKTVRVVTITQEKTIDTNHSSADLAKHLAFHGIEVVLEEEEAAGRTIGQALKEYTTAHAIDLLVMGAYGHSRLRDFILGGATKTIIAHPPSPVLLSH
ncbi:MAG: universal stress protein [Rhizobiaceae bacterium]|nr:universal stress protein [Rhizobiaceae bacterium]